MPGEREHKAMNLLQHLVAYNAWALQRTLDAVERHSGDAAPALEPLAHLLTAELVWLMRIRGEETSQMDLSPDLSLEDCRRLTAETAADMRRLVEEHAEGGLTEAIVYRNSRGLEFQTPLRDVLLHVLLHGAYHRGQVASALRRMGGEPANTDYITFVREVGPLP